MTTTGATTFAEELLAFIRTEVVFGDDSLTVDTDLLSTGLVDSLGVLLIVEWIEDRLGVEIDPGDVVIEHFASVAAMVTYLRSRGDGGSEEASSRSSSEDS